MDAPTAIRTARTLLALVALGDDAADMAALRELSGAAHVLLTALAPYPLAAVDVSVESACLVDRDAAGEAVALTRAAALWDRGARFVAALPRPPAIRAVYADATERGVQVLAAAIARRSAATVHVLRPTATDRSR